MFHKDNPEYNRRQVGFYTLDELVPKDHLLRKVEETIDFSFIYDVVEDSYSGSLSTVVGDEKLTSRENLIGFLFLYVQSDENTLPKVNKVSKTEAQTFDVFDKLIGPLQFCI